MSIAFLEKVQKIKPRRITRRGLFYTEEPKRGHAEDSSEYGYLVVGDEARPDFYAAYRVPLHYHALDLYPCR